MSQETLATGRSRRSRKAIDYSQEQQFSDDDDVFDDVKVEKSKKSKSRRSNANTGGYGLADASGVSTYKRDKPVYVERGYDLSSYAPIRERFTFEPEYDDDGTRLIETIVGRRPIEDTKDRVQADGHGLNGASDVDDSDEDGPSTRRNKKKPSKKSGEKEESKGINSDHDYEYLLKYKGRSYLHLEWMGGADLESMNTKSKGMYRRFLKKLDQESDEDLEDPTIDPSFTEPGRILAEEDHEIMVELTGKELAKWEKEQRQQMEELEESDSEEEELEKPADDGAAKMETDGSPQEEKKEDPEPIEIPDPGKMDIETLRRIVNRQDPYYATYPGSNNAYRDGYITEPPRKPRPSYLIFQGIYRGYYDKQNPGLSLSKKMQILGDDWKSLSEEAQAPFIQIANDELAQFEREKVLLEKAQRPKQVWQPIRRCKAVLDRLKEDPMALIFLEPVDTTMFTDYLDIVDEPMDLNTLGENLKKIKNYEGPETFARDARRIWNNCKIYNQHGSQIWYVADYMSKLFEKIYHAWVLDFRDKYIRWANLAARPWDDPKLMAKLNKDKLLVSARKKGEMGDIPKKMIKQKMFLVKWAGLGYDQCSWETKKDINDDTIIAEFHRLEGVTPDEPDLTESQVQGVVENSVSTMKGDIDSDLPMANMRAQLYAQSRAFHFKKFGMSVPSLVGAECGPNEKALTNPAPTASTPEDIVACVNELVWKISQGERLSTGHKSLPPCLLGEYDAAFPVTPHGLLLNVGEVKGMVAIMGYRNLPGGGRGPAEVSRLLRKTNDIIIAVNGQSTLGKSFKEVVPMLKAKSGYCHMRLVHEGYQANLGLTTSVGQLGRFIEEDFSRSMKEDRRRFLAKRSLALLNDQEEGSDSDEDAGSEAEASDSEDSEVSGMESDSEDEALTGVETNNSMDEGADVRHVAKKEETRENMLAKLLSSPDAESLKVTKQQTTRHLAYSLLDMDIGYSSDEGGDEDVAYFMDGVDFTFTRSNEVTPPKDTKVSSKDEKKEDTIVTLPVKKTDFGQIGKRAQLQIAVAITGREPDLEDFDNFPRPSTKQIAMAKAKAEEEARNAEEEARKLEELKKKKAEEASKPKVKSKTKVEQISPANNETVRVWINAADAAATLNLSIEGIQNLLDGGYDAEDGDEFGGYRWRYADQDAEVTGKATSGRESKKGREAYLKFKDKLYDSKKPHLYKNGNKLRDYQVDGVNWLSSCFYHQQGAILADEMGLGKTVQIVSYLEHLHRVEKISGPFLVVVPLSTIEHWRREFDAWTDMQCCVYHDRMRQWRDVLREYEWYYEDRPHTPDYLKFNVLVTTYDTLISDFDVIGDVPWRVTVVDEAHRLRNVKGKLLECMKETSAKGTMKYGYQSRVLMTGTPLQNNTQELWTLLNFIEPSLFRSLQDFETNFGNMANREQVDALQRKISPFMLRRVKEDVAKDIPAKEETVIDVELTSIQKQYYRAIFEQNHAFLSRGTSKAGAPSMMNIQMELRKCCNHPFLLDGIESREMEKRHEDLYAKGELDGKSPEEQHSILNEYGYVMSSGKMVLLDKLLPKLRSEGHKVLIFSQFVKMLDLISDYCTFRDFRHERLDGRVRGTERQKAIDRFETEEDSFIFLLSTRAGGVGINLTAADICIIFDSDWNPQNDVQAQARCHRIGQTKDVMIYRLVTSRTFEQEMFDRASKKLGLEQAILGTFDKEDDKPDSKEMEQLLKRGAYALLEDENDETGNAFVADDIEQILEKRTRKRVIEGAKTASWLNKKGMNVTKSTFKSEGEGGIDVDDPLFWQKVMPDFVTPEILLNKLSELEDEFEASKSKRGGKKSKGDGLSRAKQRKIKEFMTDLKGVMEDIYEQDRNMDLSQLDKDTCQKLLLTISSKESMFNKDQRDTAQKMLDQLEGNRRRRCRTSTAPEDVGVETSGPSIRKELLIVKKKKTKKKTKKKDDVVVGEDEDGESDSDGETKSRKKKKRSDSLDEDGFKKHSDDEADWSDVDDDPYKAGQKTLSSKEVERRREWGTGKSDIKMAGMAWPVFPRNSIHLVLGAVLDEVIRIDQEGLGNFSQPVPPETFPDYYDVVDDPMDYGTMREKLEKGEYRSAQQVQKDFLLVMQNCIKYNDPDSDIVKEARRQTLLRPKILKNAARKNNLFIAEDASVIPIVDQPEGKKKGSKAKGKASKKRAKTGDDPTDEGEDGTKKKKPRIKLKMPQKADKETVGRKRKATGGTDGSKKKKSRKSNSASRSKEPVVLEMHDAKMLEDEYMSLADGFDLARENIVKRGRWTLPPEIESEFESVAKLTLTNISKYDEFDIFMEPVDIPGYQDIIKNPMDFNTMRAKVDGGGYGKKDQAGKLYDDFLLAFDNCKEFNGEGEVFEEAGKALKALPIVFAKACDEVVRSSTLIK